MIVVITSPRSSIRSKGNIGKPLACESLQRHHYFAVSMTGLDVGQGRRG